MHARLDCGNCGKCVCSRLKCLRSESEKSGNASQLQVIHNVGVTQSTVGSIKCETVNAHTRDVNVFAASAESLVADLVLQGSGPNLGIIN